jgi:glycosyltransferase domain-containing protein
MPLFYKNVRIIVADGSSHGVKLDNIPNNIEYYHLPNTGYISRLKHASDKVKTKYVYMCGDDDFIDERSILIASKYLESHSEYSAVSGLYYIAIKNTNKNTKLYSEKMLDLSESTDIKERLINLGSNNGKLVYSLVKTKVFSSIVGSLFLHKGHDHDNTIIDCGQLDVLFPLLLALNGRIKELNLPLFYKYSAGIFRNNHGNHVGDLECLFSLKKIYIDISLDYISLDECMYVLERSFPSWILYFLNNYCKTRKKSKGDIILYKIHLYMRKSRNLIKSLNSKGRSLIKSLNSKDRFKSTSNMTAKKYFNKVDI